METVFHFKNQIVPKYMRLAREITARQSKGITTLRFRKATESVKINYTARKIAG